ncbi:hypothetical protein ACFE04_002971 [Oxalis oulophora]
MNLYHLIRIGCLMKDNKSVRNFAIQIVILTFPTKGLNLEVHIRGSMYTLLFDQGHEWFHPVEHGVESSLLSLVGHGSEVLEMECLNLNGLQLETMGDLKIVELRKGEKHQIVDRAVTKLEISMVRLLTSYRKINGNSPDEVSFVGVLAARNEHYKITPLR